MIGAPRAFSVDVTSTAQSGTGLLHIAFAGQNRFDVIPMTEVEPNVYDAVVPWNPCPDELAYYFSAESMTDALYTEPWPAPLAPGHRP